MRLEFYLSKNERLNFCGEIINTEYKLNCYDDEKYDLSFSSLDELLNIPFKEPGKFLEYVKGKWSKEEIALLISDGEYIVDGESFYFKEENGQ